MNLKTSQACLTAANVVIAVLLAVKAYPTPFEFSIEDIVKNNSGSTVVVGAVGTKGSSLGSGFIVSSDGLIVTNFHVVHTAVRIGVKFKNNKTYNNVRLVAFDSKKDIAILKIDATGLKPVVLGDSNNIKVGEKVIAIGNPLGLERSVADGLVSSLRDIEKGLRVLQISVPVSPGSSGGPLFNLQGEVIGITVGTNVRGQNINFAIPINYVKPLLPSYLKNNNSRIQKSGLESKTTISYIIKSKDTLFSIARKFHTTVPALMELNGLKNAKIFNGQTLKIPHSP